MQRWNIAHARHLLGVFRQGRYPAAAVYDSLGADFFLAPAPGWLNLGLWEGPGDLDEALIAPRRLVETLANALPADAAILDVANGLGAQDLVIAEVARPRRLIALNLTESQLRAGRERLRAAGALPVVADAGRIPLARASVDGVICVEAAFHFRSRAEFFAEARRVLRPGGVLVTSDISAERGPRRFDELIAGLATLRVWGLRRDALASAAQIGRQAESAGFADVKVSRCAERVFDPALNWVSARLDQLERAGAVPRSQMAVARLTAGHWRLLRERGLMDYLLLRASVPESTSTVRATSRARG
ncbi:MAG TPA: methyltransferase domain-containing protein [Egibacteraceae bacterium]|nr:methyltransferase domain-containing protein [Egibacteraceae bacterium]